jgi:hypothetical protein
MTKVGMTYWYDICAGQPPTHKRQRVCTLAFMLLSASEREEPHAVELDRQDPEGQHVRP